VKATRLVRLAKAAGVKLATAESCTGGLIAGAITAVPGSSAVFTHGFVTYGNDAKAEMLGVEPGLIEAVGAVSSEVAAAMAQGALARGKADVAVSVTGIAGPDGGSAEKPVGTVWFGLAKAGGVTTYHRLFAGSRRAVRAQSVDFALGLLSKEVSTSFCEQKEAKKLY